MTRPSTPRNSIGAWDFGRRTKSPNDRTIVEGAGVFGVHSTGNNVVIGGLGSHAPSKNALSISENAPSGVVTPPTVTKEGPLKFPPAAALAGRKEADVVLDITVRADGTVGNITKVKGDEIFVDAAKDSLKRLWEFSPGTRGGVPIESSFELTLSFRR